MTLRDTDSHKHWALRPWIMAVIGASAALLFHFLTTSSPIPPWKQAAATFVLIAPLLLIVTAELRRLWWAAVFAVAWGATTALVGWFTARYNVHGTIFEWPFLSGIAAVLLAAPLFQTLRDEGDWSLPYVRLHGHAWTDAVIGAASLAFTGVVFLLAWLIAGLFGLIGIDAVRDLLEQAWFGWTLAGFAFGAAFGLLRERASLLATLQRLVMVVFSVLAPVLALALVLFLASLPLTGLAKLWDSSVPTTPLLLLAGAGAILLANAVIGNGVEDRSSNPVLRWSALALVLTILPLSVIAAMSMAMRIQQYGWTPERMWGVVAVGIAIAYGLAGWWSVYRKRREFDDTLRPLQTSMAFGLCALTLSLALPLVDFGAISAQSQLARLKAGKIKAEEFDWRAMAFDFGPEGRERLSDLAKAGGGSKLGKLADEALAAQSRYEVDVAEQVKTNGELDRYLRKIPADLALSPELRRAIAITDYCRKRACVLIRIADNRMVLAGRVYDRLPVDSEELVLREGGQWVTDSIAVVVSPDFTPDLAKATVEIRTVQRKQLFIDGKPIGDEME